MSRRTALKEALSLPANERLELVMEIWDSLASEELPLSAELEKELDRRLDLYRADPTATVSWDEVRDELRREL